MNINRVVIIVLLGVSLLIQNTCPRGAAGKSMVAASLHPCSLKFQSAPDPYGGPAIARPHSPSHYPLYVLSVSPPVHTVRPALVETASSALAERYADALSRELLRPPQA